MGAWGYGILQNDSAQNDLCGFGSEVRNLIASLGTPGEETTAKLGTCIGILLQISPYSFDPENALNAEIMKALEVNRPFFSTLPGNGPQILQSVLDGKGIELYERDAAVDEDIDKALHSDENEGFIMQRVFGPIEADLFAHPVSATLLQSLVDGLVANVDAGFDDEEMVEDLSRESEFMGEFALLLILPKAKVDPALFAKWQKRFHAVCDGSEIHAEEPDFYDAYNKWLKLAFECGQKRYA